MAIQSAPLQLPELTGAKSTLLSLRSVLATGCGVSSIAAVAIQSAPSELPELTGAKSTLLSLHSVLATGRGVSGHLPEVNCRLRG